MISALGAAGLTVHKFCRYRADALIIFHVVFFKRMAHVRLGVEPSVGLRPMAILKKTAQAAALTLQEEFLL